MTLSYYDIYHSGIPGMRWGVRRYQNPDGTLTEAGKERYRSTNPEEVEESLEDILDKKLESIDRKRIREFAVSGAVNTLLSSAGGMLVGGFVGGMFDGPLGLLAGGTAGGILAGAYGLSYAKKKTDAKYYERYVKAMESN